MKVHFLTAIRIHGKQLSNGGAPLKNQEKLLAHIGQASLITKLAHHNIGSNSDATHT